MENPVLEMGFHGPPGEGLGGRFACLTFEPIAATLAPAAQSAARSHP